MTAIREDALAAWDGAEEAERIKVLARAEKRATRAYQAEAKSGQASELRAPTFEVIGARRVHDRLVAIVASSYRVYHYAQSGSDWSKQTVTIVQSTLDAASIIECVLFEDTRNIAEGESDDHDDAAELRDVIARWLHDHAPLIDRAVDAAALRAEARSPSRAAGAPFERRGSPSVDLVEARKNCVTTCTANRIYFREPSGVSFRVYVAIEDTVLDKGALSVRTLFERHTERFSEAEDHDDDKFARGTINAWRSSQKR